MSGNKVVMINDTTDPQNNTDLGMKIIRTVVVTPAAAVVDVKIYDDTAANAATLKIHVRAQANGLSVPVAYHGLVFGKGSFIVLTGAGGTCHIEQGL